MNQTIQQIGEKGEKDLLSVLTDLLSLFSRISSLRRCDSGFQEGKDIKAEGTFNKGRNEIALLGEQKYKWFFEVKNYKSKIDGYKIAGKVAQLSSSQHKFDIYCVFSPHEDVPSLWEDNFTSEKIFCIPQYPFGIVFWTPAQQIKEKLKAFPEIYEQIYGEKISISEDVQKAIQKEWIDEIRLQTEAGNKKQLDFIKLFKTDNQVWIPDSIKEAKQCISDAGELKRDGKKSNRLRTKLNYGGINSEPDILNAKMNRMYSEAIRRKYKKMDEGFYCKLNELRLELYNFCAKIESVILSSNKKDEALFFLLQFEKELDSFKKNYRDSSLIERLPEFYFKGQMFDITGECLLNLSNKWLNEVKENYDI